MGGGGRVGAGGGAGGRTHARARALHTRQKKKKEKKKKKRSLSETRNHAVKSAEHKQAKQTNKLQICQSTNKGMHKETNGRSAIETDN